LTRQRLAVSYFVPKTANCRFTWLPNAPLSTYGTFVDC
jgi:hypothetical protein